MIAPTSEVAWLRAEIARVEREGLDRGLDALAQGAASADHGPLPEPVREAARTVALAELAVSHGEAVAHEYNLIVRGAA